MLYVWTGASGDALDETVGAALAQTPYEIVGVDDFPPQGDGNVVLAMGRRTTARMEASGLVPPGRKIDSLRGQRIQAPTIASDFLVTFDPWLTKHDKHGAKIAEQIRWDARLAARLVTTGSLRPPALASANYQWVQDLGFLVEWVQANAAARPCIAHDLETMGLYPWYENKEIITSAWSPGPGVAYVVDHRGDPRMTRSPELRRQIEILMTWEVIRLWGANLKFDAPWHMLKWLLRCSNITFDMTLGGSLVNENRHNSVNTLTKEYAPQLGGYDDEFNAAADKGRMELELEKNPAKFLEYAGADVDAVHQAGVPIAAELAKDPALTRFYQKLLLPAARAFEMIERRGVLVDVPKLEALGQVVHTAVRDHTRVAMEQVPLPVKAAHYMKGLRFSRKGFLCDLLFTPEGFNLQPTVMADKMKPHRFDMGWENDDGEPRMPSTSIKDHLGRFRQHPEAGGFIRELEAINSAEKTLGTYIGGPKFGGKGFLAHLHPDSLFHPTYILYSGGLHDDDNEDETSGTNTGRLAAKEPAVQTLPKHTVWAKQLRKCYPAPPGYVCWQLDFSQGELRFAACLANELRMLDAYRRGFDLHAITAARLNEVPFDQFMSWKGMPEGSPERDRFDALRQGGKAGNFGLLYSMGPGGFVEYAWKTYGVIVDIEKAREWRDEFFQLYPGLLVWHDEYRQMARRDGQVRSPLGRIRHLPLINSPDRELRAKAERQAINSPVQGGLSDLTLFAIGHIEAAFGQYENECRTVGSTHDSIYGYAREQTGEQWVAELAGVVNCMPIRETFGWEHQIPFPVDAEIGDTMGSLEELKLAA